MVVKNNIFVGGRYGALSVGPQSGKGLSSDYNVIFTHPDQVIVGDKDQGWQAELAIPLVAARGRSKAALTLPPTVGQVWRANLFRTDKPAKGGLKAWAWSPPLRSTFHALDRFGELVFADAKGRIKPASGKPFLTLQF